MTEQPAIAFPALGIAKEDSMSLWQSLDNERTCSLYAFVKGYWNRLTLFDASGMRWEVAEAIPTRKISTLAKWLAPICYNPHIKVKLRFKDPRPYELGEVQKLICWLIDRDDDIMTQFVEADVLKTDVRTATSFTDLIALLTKSHAV